MVRRLTVLVVLVAAMLAVAGPAWAETFTVTNLSDSGSGSLRQAVADANATSEADTIQFGLDAGDTITLASTITVTSPLTIEGPGAQALTISGNSAVRPFYVDETTLNISGLTIADGRIGDVTSSDAPANYGGAIFNEGGALTIRGSALTDNASGFNAYRGGAIANLGGSLRLIDSRVSGYAALYGGAIHNAGMFFAGGVTALTGSTLSGNFALGDGGAIYNGGAFSLFASVEVTAASRVDGNGANGNGGGIYNEGGSYSTIADSTVSGNSTSDGVGGGVYNSGSRLVIERSTFSGNRSAVGGGIYAAFNPSTITDSTFVGNESIEEGGGIAIGGGSATISNSTLSGNRATFASGGGIAIVGGSATVRGTIVAGNTARLQQNPDVEGNYADGGFNIIDGTAAEAKLQTDANGAPVLSNNGGPTQTVALVRGSKAIDAGNSFGSTIDQRGETRPKDYASVDNAPEGDGSDIGAFEYVDPDASSPTVEASVTPLPNGGGLNNSDVTVAIDATDEDGGSGVWRVSYSASGAQQVPEQNVAGDSAELKISADGETTVTYWATDGAGNRSESQTITVRVDSAAPTVTRATPTGPKILPGANVTATFSEAMDGASVGARGAFTLKEKGSTRVLSAAVTYDEETMKATLNPAKKLRSGATYVATVSTAATDPAGNALDQNPNTAGNQPKTWRFKVR